MFSREVFQVVQFALRRDAPLEDVAHASKLE